MTTGVKARTAAPLRELGSAVTITIPAGRGTIVGRTREGAGQERYDVRLEGGAILSGIPAAWMGEDGARGDAP